MWKDEIVEEVRYNRDAYAARFNYDLNAIYNDLKANERRNKRILFSFSPKQPLIPAAKTLNKTVDG
jgi:hypothetical protein